MSSVGGFTGNLLIARGVTIQAALGGSGADMIVGNAADNRLADGGGADRLYGLAGDDHLSAGAGVPGSAADLILPASRDWASVAAAISVAGHFSLAFKDDIVDSTVRPHVAAVASSTG